MPHIDHALLECIDACRRCHDHCLSEIQHCLTLGGDHAEPTHVGLMLDCARTAETAAALMLTGSRFYRSMCAVCAQIAEACAQQCDVLGDMDECAQVCRTCAQLCEQMGLPAAEAG